MESQANLSSHDQPFPFLSLPFELRLKIYTLLLPPRIHRVSTQIPSNGYYYSTLTLPCNTTQSFYPFGRRSPTNLTTYKVLNKNWSRDYPNESIWPEILRTCRQVKQEGERVLYGGSGVEFEFGEVGAHNGNGKAMKNFFMDRCKSARDCVRRVSIAREIPTSLHLGGFLETGIDEEWEKTCSFLRAELTGLRELNLIIWSANGQSLLNAQHVARDQEQEHDNAEEEEKLRNEVAKKKLRDWEWTRELIDLEGLRQARVAWWGFQDMDQDEGKEGGFDSWIARRMVGDRVVRERMIREGRVIEGFVVMSGGGA